jgi:hypothetical protein
MNMFHLRLLFHVVMDILIHSTRTGMELFQRERAQTTVLFSLEQLRFGTPNFGISLYSTRVLDSKVVVGFCSLEREDLWNKQL